jgi:hypothetical protein
MAAALLPFVRLPSLRGIDITSFLAYFIIAAAAYFLAVFRLDRDQTPLQVVWFFALLFRGILLFTSPTLSDDVFRYIWDGHLLGEGVNPYLYPVEVPGLDTWGIPLRSLVNHPWMASPYLPIAQLYFGLVDWLAPQSTLGFQLGAVGFDLVTGWLVMDMLGRLAFPKQRVLLYLWNPLVVVEYAHGAHVDALMICLMAFTTWLIIRARPDKRRGNHYLTVSVLSLAAATLTKGLAVILAPLFIRQWGWQRLALFGIILFIFTGSFAVGAGWGLWGPLDGTGVFGAIRIYLNNWNYNSSVFHWLEVVVGGYLMTGVADMETAKEYAFQIARLVSGLSLALVILATGVWAWRLDRPRVASELQRNRALLRLACIPLGAYLLLTASVNPWYVTIILPFVLYLLPADGEKLATGRFVWPWLYLSCAVVFSYLTYFDPADLREFYFIRWIEYAPFFLLLVWAILPYVFRYWQRGSRLT